jgi:hypothetical protein
MSKPINLRAARKARERDRKRAEGDANAARFGRTKAERQNEARAEEKARATWEAHKRDPE